MFQMRPYSKHQRVMMRQDRRRQVGSTTYITPVLEMLGRDGMQALKGYITGWGEQKSFQGRETGTHAKDINKIRPLTAGIGTTSTSNIYAASHLTAIRKRDSWNRRCRISSTV